MNLEIDSARLLSEIEALALISEAEPTVVTRIVFTPADMRAHAWMIERCLAAGLAVRREGRFPKGPLRHFRLPFIETHRR
jgi:ureidoglycolate amidohydrolase